MFIVVIHLNNSDSSYVIFIVLKWLSSSSGSMTRTHLIAVIFQKETGTDFNFFNLVFSCVNSAPFMSKLVFELSTLAVLHVSETSGSFERFF